MATSSCMIDADGSTDPAEIPLFVKALTDGADFAKGSRFVDNGGSTDITTLRRIGNKGLNTIVNVAFHTKFSDLCYGYNAFWARHAELMELPPTQYSRAQWGDGFEIETVINVRLATAGIKITEVGSLKVLVCTGAATSTPTVTACACCVRSVRNGSTGRPTWRPSGTVSAPAARCPPANWPGEPVPAGNRP